MHPISAIVLYTTEHRSYHQLKCSFISLLPAVFHASFQTAQRRKIKAMASEHINLSLCTSLCLIFFALLACKAVACFFPEMASQTEIAVFVTSLTSFCLHYDNDVTISHFHLLCFGGN